MFYNADTLRGLEVIDFSLVFVSLRLNIKQKTLYLKLLAFNNIYTA